MRTIWFLLFLPGSSILKAQQVSPLMLGQSTPKNGLQKNMGQARDLDNKPVNSVYYQANLGGQQVFITNYELPILLSKKNRVIKRCGMSEGNISSKGIFTNKVSRTDSLFIVSYEMERIDIVLKYATILPANIVTKPGELALDIVENLEAGLESFRAIIASLNNKQ